MYSVFAGTYCDYTAQNPFETPPPTYHLGSGQASPSKTADKKLLPVGSSSSCGDYPWSGDLREDPYPPSSYHYGDSHLFPHQGAADYYHGSYSGYKEQQLGRSAAWPNAAAAGTVHPDTDEMVSQLNAAAAAAASAAAFVDFASPGDIFQFDHQKTPNFPASR